MRLRITEPAEADLKAIVRYIAQENPAAASHVYRAIMKAAHGLPEFPQVGRVGRTPETRELVLTEVPYLLVYGVAKGEVTLLAIFHGAMNLAARIEGRAKP